MNSLFNQTKSYDAMGMSHLKPHRKIAVTCGAIAWFWMMWRAKQDGAVAFVKK